MENYQKEEEYNPNVLHYWFLDHQDKTSIKQCMFFRDIIGYGLIDNYNLRKEPKVISTHVSKSILLPVIEFSAFDGDLRLIVRDNFHDFKTTVLSKYSIDSDFHGILIGGEKTSKVYFEGFDPNLVRPAYRPGMKEFSVSITDEYNFTMFTRILRSCFERKNANEKCEPFLFRQYNYSLFIVVYFLPSVHIGGATIRDNLLETIENSTAKYITLDFSDCQMMSNEWMSFINKKLLNVPMKIRVCGMRNELRNQAETLNCTDLLKASIETSGK